MTIHCLPHFFLNWNWPKHSSNSISASFFLQSSRKKVWIFFVSLHFPCFESTFLDSMSVLLPLCFEKYHARSRVCLILVSVHWLRVSVFDFITGVYVKSGVCALFHDSGCFIHIMFVVFYHIICHLNPCNAQCSLDSKLLMFITIFDCLFDLLCPFCLWLLVFNLVLVSVIEWNLPVSHSYTWI